MKYKKILVHDISQAIDNINRDLEFIKSWSMRFGLSGNPSKCQAILVIINDNMINQLDSNSIPPVVLNGLFIPWSQVVNLDLFINPTLDWRAQLLCPRKWQVIGEYYAVL